MEVVKATTRDIVDIKRLLESSPALATNRLLRDITEHIVSKECTALVMREGSITGVWLSREFEEYVSLSFFFIVESKRKKLDVLIFFKYCYDNYTFGKPVYIKTSDISTFERYVEHVEDDVYLFKGLR